MVILFNCLIFLGIFKIKNESYESIKKCLKHLTEKLRAINEIEINNQTYQIEFYAGGDLKWLSNCFGINAANSKYPCPFCTFEMQDIMTSNDILVQNWPITRSHNEALIIGLGFICIQLMIEKAISTLLYLIS